MSHPKFMSEMESAHFWSGGAKESIKTRSVESDRRTWAKEHLKDFLDQPEIINFYCALIFRKQSLLGTRL